MKKRIICIMLILCFAAVGIVLTACDTASAPNGGGPTDAPAPTEQATEAPTEPPTEAVDYKTLYLDFLGSTDIEYDFGGLIYLNDDDIPELYLGTIPTAAGDYVCYILNGKVESYETYSTSFFRYGERRGCFSLGAMHQGHFGWMLYGFDGEQVTEIHSGRSYNDEYWIDEKPVSKEEYDAVENEYKCDSRPKTARSEPDLKKLIEDF